MDDHRISVDTRHVDILFSHGNQISGEIFLQLHGTKSYAPQKIEEILNGDDEFIPLRSNGKVELLNTKHIVALTCEADREQDDLQTLGEHYVVSIETVSGKFDDLNVFVNLPSGKKRIKDFLNQPKTFLYFSKSHKGLYLQRDMIVRVSD